MRGRGWVRRRAERAQVRVFYRPLTRDRPSASHGGGRNSNGPSKGRVGTVRENGAHAPGPEPANSPLPVRRSGRSLARGPMARNRQSGPIEPVHPVARVERRGWRGGGHEADHGHAPPQGPLLFRLPARRAVDGPDASRRDEARRGGVRPVRSRERLRVPRVRPEDRKSTRLNSSHITISYAVFCLKKKTYSETISE